MSKKVRRKRIVVGQDWSDAEIEIHVEQRKFAVLKMLLLAALALIAFTAVYFAATGDRSGMKAIMVFATNLITGGASWALGHHSKK